jgi:fimbrial chaperone protein
MSRVKALLALTLLASSAISSVNAQSLRVTPVTVELPAGTESAVLTLGTDSKEGVAVQARVFRWSQTGGEDKLDKTEDVMVSPPVLTVRGGTPSTLRLVRVAKTPVSGEETYRVLIDEIPDRKKLQSGTVLLRVRQSVPVFFAGADARPGSITWKATEQDRKLVIEVTNAGQKRVRFNTVTVTDDRNRDLLKGGLFYVLNGQSKRWELQADAAGAKTLTIKAETDAGPVNASVNLGKGG